MAEAENNRLQTVVAVVDLEETDALRVENSQLKLTMAARDMEMARRAYADEMRNQAEVVTVLSKKYDIDATQYDFDPETKKLRLRQRPHPGMPPVAPTPIIPPDAE
jgi:hypothetical protein